MRTMGGCGRKGVLLGFFLLLLMCIRRAQQGAGCPSPCLSCRRRRRLALGLQKTHGCQKWGRAASGRTPKLAKPQVGAPPEWRGSLGVCLGADF